MVAGGTTAVTGDSVEDVCSGTYLTIILGHTGIASDVAGFTESGCGVREVSIWTGNRTSCGICGDIYIFEFSGIRTSKIYIIKGKLSLPEIKNYSHSPVIVFVVKPDLQAEQEL